MLRQVAAHVNWTLLENFAKVGVVEELAIDRLMFVEKEEVVVVAASSEEEAVVVAAASSEEEEDLD